MRGRTNAEPNIGVQLNASVDTYEIATGETILAGDFVEQFNYLVGESTTSGNLIDTFQTDEQHIFKMSDGKYLYFGAYNSSSGSSYRNIEIYEKDELGVLTLVAQPTSIPFISVGKTLITQLSDDTLAYIYVTNSMYVYVRLIHYDSSNYSITTKTINAQLASISGTATSYQFSIIKKRGGGYKVFASYYIVNPSAVYSADMVINGNTYDTYTLSLSNIKTIVSTTSSGSYSLGYAVELDANYYLARYSYKYNSSTTRYCYYIVDEVNDITNTYTFNNSDFTIGSLLNRNSFDNLIYTIYVDTTNDKVLLKRYYMDTSEYTAYPDEELFDFSGDSIQTVYLGSDATNDIYVILKSTTEIVPFTINKSTHTMTLFMGCVVDFTMGVNRGVASRLDNGNFLFVSLQKIISMNYSNGELESEVETVKQVKGITTQKYIKGVAKQSGTAGDTIVVYIPQVNS